MQGKQSINHYWNLLGVPEDKIIAGGILMGYPKVRYRNIVERQPLDVTFDTEE